mgnify:CR=1 FL=1
MAEKVNNEPVLAVPVSKVMWVLVIVIVYLSYVVLGFTDHVEKIIVNRAEKLYSVIDHEMDDTNDNYEETLQLLLQSECEEALIKYKQIACQIETKGQVHDIDYRTHGTHPKR